MVGLLLSLTSCNLLQPLSSPQPGSTPPPPTTWPKFHHDASQTGLSQFSTSASTSAQKWKLTTGGPVRSSPALGSDGTIYVGSDDGHLYAVKSDGTLRWKFLTGGPVKSSPAVGADGTIYVGSGDGNLYAVNAAGPQKWKFPVGGGAVNSSPAIAADGTIYIGSSNGNVYAVRPNGTQRWKFPIPAGASVVRAAAIGADGTIYIGAESPDFYALDPGGTLKWTFTHPVNPGTSSAAVGADGTIYVGSQDGSLHALKPDGMPKWAFPTGGNITGSSPAIGSDGTIYVGSMNQNLYAVTPGGMVKWTFPTGSPVFESSPAIGADGTIYVGSGDGNVYALDPTGMQKWKVLTGGRVESSPAIGDDGTIYVGSDDGSLYALGSPSTTPPCNCCSATRLRFTIGTPQIGQGGCGTVKDASSSTLISVDCGGLYFGGGNVNIPLPAVVPDLGAFVTKLQNCAGGVFDLAGTTAADTGSHRTCTSAGVADPDYPACVGGARSGAPCRTDSDCTPGTCSGTLPGCLFGSPLPIPNSTFVGASVCLVNRISATATGSGTCGGAANVTLPLTSDLYLEGDLLDGSVVDRPTVAGIQPCPLCRDNAPPGGTCAAAHCCWGGPRHDKACTPGSAAFLGASYPTSHDCPPPAGPSGANYIGALPLPLALTTDPTGTDPSAHKVATFQNAQEVFCGVCSNAAGVVFRNPPVACLSNADCSGLAGCPGTFACSTCKQRSSGAFGTASTGPGTEHEITLIGSPAGVCLADDLAHAATLVSAFCIPPAFNATVDANGDIPGPGALALPGEMQLLP